MMKDFIKHFLLILATILLSTSTLSAQDCSVNAGGAATICGTSYALQGSSNGNTVGNPTWTLVSKPIGAPNPSFSNLNSYTPTVTGMTFPGNYVFQIAQPCNSGSTTSQVTITAPGDVSTFTAGPDITNVNATVGTVNLTGNVPAGYTAQWSAYNLWRFQRSGTRTMENAMFTSTSSSSTTFSLIKKANHDIDPSYVVTLRITSINNPSCFYEDTLIVRFIPNPQIVVPTNYSRCWSATEQKYLPLSSTSPIFGTTTAGAAGNPAFGTTVTMNVNSQPAGANISYLEIIDGLIDLNGITVAGTYKFTLTVQNSSGTYITPEITYIFPGFLPNSVSFLVASEPEQMMIYDAGSTGGEVQCGLLGMSTPLTFKFTINPSDSPTLTTTVRSSGIIPPGGAPTITTSGAGTMTRSATITPPAGGWRAGTYVLTVETSNGSCNAINQDYYIHISDGNRPNVAVPNTTVCYPGSGSVTATIALPAVYKGVVNSSYFQDFDAQYDFTVVSKPAGSGTPTFLARNLRLFTNTSTQIGNLTTPGEYVFRIKSNPYTTSVGAFLDKEYACSGTSREATFSVFVTPQINANAGSDQNVTCNNMVSLSGNSPGVGTGTWTVVSAPGGATPVIANPSLFNTNVSSLTVPGTYTFRWTINTGTCTSTDDVNVVIQACPIISGTVWNDSNGNAVLDSSETGINPGTLYANLVNENNGLVAASAPVAANGIYNLTSTAPGTYSVILTNTVKTVGSGLATSDPLPGNWQHTGTNVGGVANTANQTGIITGITVTSSNITGINFGMKSCPVFTSNQTPGTQTVCQNVKPAILAVSADNVTYQWYTNTTNSNIGGTPISGATSSTYDPPSSSTVGTTYYYAVITNAFGCSTASIVRGITVNPPPTIITQPDSTPQNLCVNSPSTTLSVTASNALTYQWFYSDAATNGTLTSVTGATSPSYTVPTNTAFVTRYYFVRVYNGSMVCSTISSPRTPVTVNAAPTGVTITPPTQTVLQNATPSTLTATATGATSYQWYSNTTNTNTGGTLISSATSLTYIPPTNTLGTKYYYIVASNTTCSVASAAAQVNVVQCSAADPVSVDLNTQFNIPAGPAGTLTQWHTSATPSPATLISNSTVMATSTPKSYWVFYYDQTNTCYSPGSKVVVVSNACCNFPTVDLTSLPQSAPPAGAQMQWYLTRNRVNGSLITNLTAVPDGVYFPYFFDSVNNCYSMTGTPVLVMTDQTCTAACYKPGLTTGGTVLDTKVGITSLGRAGADNADNWPMSRKGGHIALESKTKAFVPNRVAFSDADSNPATPQTPVGIPAANFVEGMMVYDIANNCMKIYTLKDGDTIMAWHCVTTQACPD